MHWLCGFRELTPKLLFQFAKPPSGEEEVAIAQFMQECFKAINARDSRRWLACFADDAMIDSKAARAVVSKSSYEITMSRFIRFFISVEAKDVEMKAESATRATLTGMLQSRSQGSSTGPDKHTWKLEKRSGKWLIVETRYE